MNSYSGGPHDANQNPGDERAGKTMLWLAAFGLLAGLTFLFQAADKGRGGIVDSRSSSGQTSVVLRRDRSGHYFAEGAINGQKVEFLVDTGATDVAIPQAQARALGLDFGPQVTVMTAAGPARAWRTRLAQVSLGDIHLDNVSATITEASMNEVLLGMSFLKHFSLQQNGDQLLIETGTRTP